MVDLLLRLALYYNQLSTMDMMLKLDKTAAEQIFDSESRDNLAEYDPEVARQVALRMGDTPEEAEQAAQWACKRNAEIARIRQEQAAMRQAS